MSGARELEKIRRAFDRQAPKYDRDMRSAERSLQQRRRKMVGDLRGRVLEVGIGTGATLRHYAPGVELVGIDLSPRMMAVAGRLAAERGVNLDLREMDAQRMEFADRGFDAVVFTLSLCTIPDPEAAIREAVRVAKPAAPIRMLEHVLSNLLPVALLQELVNPLTVLLQHDHVNRRVFDLAARAGVHGLTQERWFLGLYSLVRGTAPAA